MSRWQIPTFQVISTPEQEESRDKLSLGQRSSEAGQWHKHPENSSIQSLCRSLLTVSTTSKAQTNPDTTFSAIYFDGVQWVSGENQANPSETSGEEVLQRADRLLLFGHLSFRLCRESKRWQNTTNVAVGDIDGTWGHNERTLENRQRLTCPAFPQRNLSESCRCHCGQQDL